MPQQMDGTLFAFWKYSHFPYLCGGTITKMTDEGMVETIEYGPGHYFRAVKILPLKAGKELLEKIRKMERERDIVLKGVREEWDKKLGAVVDF